MAGDAALLATAWAIGHNSAHPDAGATLWAIVILVGLAVAVGAYPFVTDDARKYDQALDDRQKALQVLAGTVATAAEQVSVAAAGLQVIADAAQENFRKSEALTAQLAGHIAEFDRRLGGEGLPKADPGDSDARIDAAVKKITRAASALEVTLTKTVEVVRTMPPFVVPPPPPAPDLAPAAPPAPAHAEVPPVFPEHIVEIRPVLPATDDSAAPIPVPAPPAAGTAAPEAAAPPEQPAEPKPVRKRAPRKPKAEAAPEAPPATPAPTAEATPEPAPEPAPPRVPAAAAATPPAPDVVAAAAADTIPPLSFGEEDAAMDEDFSPPPPEPELAEAPAPAPAAAAAPEPVEAARSTDGATRLVVTAYIGIGNRLFIRGDGPGLAWDRGIPLTFVSIGKWRWETNDAARTIHFRLFKNDTVECTALGEQTVEPGAQQELSASF